MTATYFILCIDTNSYAGNFGREMCAYATGTVGDCEVGDREATAYLDKYEEPLETLPMPDEHGCYRPVAIQPTPGYVNDGVGHDYKYDKDLPPTEEQNRIYREYKQAYQKDTVDRYVMSLKQGVKTYTREAVDREQTKLDELSGAKISEWYPAYQSIGIFFEEEPDQETIDLILTRCKDFVKDTTLETAKYRSNTISIEGYRLLRREMVETEISSGKL